MYWRFGIGIEQAAAHPRTYPHYHVARTRLTGDQGKNYESVVRMQLGWIDDTDVGRLLFRAIAREVLSATKSDLAKFQEPVDAGAPTHGVLVQPYTQTDCNAEENYAVVSYSPYTALRRSCRATLHDVTTNRGDYPWEVLFHELVHAYRDASGYGHTKTLHGGLSKYTDNEEFIAVLTTNIYMSDPTNKRADHVGLRKDHETTNKLEPYLADSLDFFASSAGTFKQVEKFVGQSPWLTKHLAETKATFNPIAVYYHHREKARKKSQGAVAAVRDFVYG